MADCPTFPTFKLLKLYLVLFNFIQIWYVDPPRYVSGEVEQGLKSTYHAILVGVRTQILNV